MRLQYIAEPIYRAYSSYVTLHVVLTPAGYSDPAEFVKAQA